jgi:DNA polymerase-1
MTTLAVDGNNLLMRAIHAMSRSGLTTNQGVSTGPLLAFIGMLSRHVREEQPDKLVICWDGGRSRHRLALDLDYKAHRLSPDQDQEEAKESAFAQAKEFCSVANLFFVERSGVEADDLIAQYVLDADPREKVVILSSDKDFLQLLDDAPHAGSVEQVRFVTHDAATDRWTAQRVRLEMGCEPEDLASAMALAGDISDNVPGVPKFGMKTAVKVLRAYEWNLEEALAKDARLVDHADRARLNLSLVDLRSGMEGLDLPPLPSFAPTTPGSMMYPMLLSFLTRYQMRGIQARLYDGTLWL